MFLKQKEKFIMVQLKMRYLSKSIRTLFFNKDLKKDHVVTKKDINRSRPGLGLKIKYLNKILGKKIKNDIKIGTPVKFNLLKN